MKAQPLEEGFFLLKPALARGDLRVIGATTPEEYQRYIAQDAALERRFQPVWVPEPRPEEALEMLRGVKARYETHHGVVIADEALEAAVKLSVARLPDRHFVRTKPSISWTKPAPAPGFRYEVPLHREVGWREFGWYNAVQPIVWGLR